MDADQRKQKIEELQKDSHNIETQGVKIAYRGQTERMNVWRIPLEYLVYNKYNGRITSRVKAFEATSHKLDPDNEADSATIEDLLWKSKEDRNKKTMDDLVKKGQLNSGIVTADGVIIDGNRRASLLNRAYRERDKHGWDARDVEKCRFFNAVILPQSATSRDIQQLETTYQMGEDAKLDYNPIEKYLKCRDLRDEGFDEKDIAEMMNESVSNVKKWLGTLEVMDQYLDSLGYQDMYPMLDHLEDHMLTLWKGLKDWRDRSSLAHADWEYTDTDIDDLQGIAFAYMRWGCEGKEFRRICKPSKDGSLFQNGQLWSEFCDRHYENLDSVEEEEVGDWLDEHQDANPVDALRARDAAWKRKVGKPLKNNYRRSVSLLDDILDSYQPEESLEKVLSLLENIDVEQPGFRDSARVAELVRKANKMTYELKKALGQ